MSTGQNVPAVVVERGDYKGSPVITLKRFDSDKFPFSFGLGKAKLILEAVEDIRRFVAEYSQPPNDGVGV